MIVFDLDNTLLMNDKSISNYTQCILEKFQNLGGRIVIATGRNYINSMEYQKKINANGLISLNGALTYFENKLIDCEYMEGKKVKVLIHNLLKIDDAFLAIAYPTKIITNNMELTANSSREYSNFNDFSLDEIHKITIFTKNHKSVNEIDYESMNFKLIINSKEPDYFVVMPKNVDKLNGIKKIVELINISLEEVICFGDDFNDLLMLKCCGKGIAVQNADDFIKSMANEVCDSNQDNGPARWIEKEIISKSNKSNVGNDNRL